MPSRIITLCGGDVSEWTLDQYLESQSWTEEERELYSQKSLEAELRKQEEEERQRELALREEKAALGLTDLDGGINVRVNGECLVFTDVKPFIQED